MMLMTANEPVVADNPTAVDNLASLSSLVHAPSVIATPISKNTRCMIRCLLARGGRVLPIRYTSIYFRADFRDSSSDTWFGKTGGWYPALDDEIVTWYRDPLSSSSAGEQGHDY